MCAPLAILPALSVRGGTNFGIIKVEKKDFTYDDALTVSLGSPFEELKEDLGGIPALDTD